MSLENLLELGRSGAIPEGLGGGPGGEAEGAGLSYETYLKLLMMLNGAETVTPGFWILYRLISVRNRRIFR